MIIAAVTVIGCSIVGFVCLLSVERVLAKATGAMSAPQARDDYLSYHDGPPLLMLMIVLPLKRDSGARAARNLNFFVACFLFAS